MEETNMKKKITNYEAPQLTVVEFRMERGYAVSDGNLIVSAQQQVNALITSEVEMQMTMGQLDNNGNVIASEMGGNQDMSNAGGSSEWQYANGGWF